MTAVRARVRTAVARVNEAMGQVVVERLGALGYTPEDGAEVSVSTPTSGA